MKSLKKWGLSDVTINSFAVNFGTIEVWRRYGNVGVYYHCVSEYGCFDCPLEVEGVEVRKSLIEDKITIY